MFFVKKLDNGKEFACCEWKNDYKKLHHSLEFESRSSRQGAVGQQGLPDALPSYLFYRRPL